VGSSVKIDFDLLGNASDSIERAIELIAWGDQQHEARRLKQAVQAVTHGIELLLKERLKRIHPALIWENVDKYPSLNARTVTSEGAVVRLRNIGNVAFSDRDTELLRSLRVTRNAIEHYVWTTTKIEADAVVGRALEFAFHFARTELNHEYMTYGEIKDGTYGSLLGSNSHFSDAVTTRSKNVKPADEHEPLVCTFCRAKAVDPVSLGCRMCGHWEVPNRSSGKGSSFDDLDDEAPF
jgi:hypothetical protein